VEMVAPPYSRRPYRTAVDRSSDRGPDDVDLARVHPAADAGNVETSARWRVRRFLRTRSSVVRSGRARSVTLRDNSLLVPCRSAPR